MPAAVDPDDAAYRWARLGADTDIELQAVEIRRVELDFIAPVLTSRGEHRRRPVVLVRLSGNERGRPVEGWGECAALADRTYDAEDVDGSFSVLEEILGPALLSLSSAEGRLPPPVALGPRAPDAPLAFAALEMAVADLHLRSMATSLADWLGVGPDPVPAGAVVGEFRDRAGLLGRVNALVDQGYARIKMKIGRDADLEPVAAVRRAHPGLFLQADANEDYTEADIDHLIGLDRYDLACLEQPFPRDDLAAHARLAERAATPVCLDESLDSPESVVRALEMGACSVVCVKPGRLGGIGSALEVVRLCAASSVPVWMGGMFETGFARAVNVVVAAASGTDWPGDLSPATSYLRQDLTVPGTAAVEPPGPSRVGPSRAPGMGPAFDPAAVDPHTTRRVQLGTGPDPGFGQG
ncbi:MAG TPA: o-succinylbenzoate synthase [Acidimicrobiales bacterium]|jgi:O-succinylbenzoate synthase|nr:o-succinylbenzoate synthase [Acidimicrobiales bacterium]